MKKAKGNKKAPAQKPAQTKAKQTKTAPARSASTPAPKQTAPKRQENYMLVKSGLDRAGNQQYTKTKVYTRKPKGWNELEGLATAPKGYAWITNGENLLSSKWKYALVKK